MARCEAVMLFAELVEVTEASFAIEKAIRTQSTVLLDDRTAFAAEAIEVPPSH